VFNCVRVKLCEAAWCYSSIFASTSSLPSIKQLQYHCLKRTTNEADDWCFECYVHEDTAFRGDILFTTRLFLFSLKAFRITLFCYFS